MKRRTEKKRETRYAEDMWRDARAYRDAHDAVAQRLRDIEELEDTVRLHAEIAADLRGADYRRAGGEQE